MAERRGTVFLLLGMLAWVIAAFAVALAAAAVLGVASVVVRRLPGLGFVSAPSSVVYILVAAAAFQGTLLLAASRQGRLAGGGDRSVGLGAGPIRNVRQVALLCVVIIVWLLAIVLLAARSPALREFAKSVTPDVLSRLGHGGPAAVVLQVMLVVVLAPVSEELFFRGWLWEACRRRGNSIAATAWLTATPWLLLHGIDSPRRILFLLPAAVVLSLARYQGGGVLASLAVHITNNTTAALMQAFAALVE